MDIPTIIRIFAPYDANFVSFAGRALDGQPSVCEREEGSKEPVEEFLLPRRRWYEYLGENDVQAYFEAQPWYKRDTGYNSGLYNNHKMTDVERQNIELVGRYLEHRYAAERKAKQ